MLRNLLAVGSLGLAVVCLSCERHEAPSSTSSSSSARTSAPTSPLATQPDSLADRTSRAMDRVTDTAQRTASDARDRLSSWGVGSTTMPTTMPNDTAINIRDRYATTTPMDQGESQVDITISAAIRRAILADSMLLNKWDDVNCKIITRNGVVTLRGPVSSDAARQEIEEKARATPGVTEVRNMLEVKGMDVTTQPGGTVPLNMNP